MEINNKKHISDHIKNIAKRTDYKIEFKVDMDGSIQYFDEDITFSIVKN